METAPAFSLLVLGFSFGPVTPHIDLYFNWWQIEKTANNALGTGTYSSVDFINIGIYFWVKVQGGNYETCVGQLQSSERLHRGDTRLTTTFPGCVSSSMKSLVQLNF